MDGWRWESVLVVSERSQGWAKHILFFLALFKLNADKMPTVKYYF